MSIKPEKLSDAVTLIDARNGIDSSSLPTINPMCLAFVSRVYGELSTQMAMFAGTGDFDGTKLRLAAELTAAIRPDARPEWCREFVDRIIYDHARRMESATADREPYEHFKQRYIDELTTRFAGSAA